MEGSLPSIKAFTMGPAQINKNTERSMATMKPAVKLVFTLLAECSALCRNISRGKKDVSRRVIFIDRIFGIINPYVNCIEPQEGGLVMNESSAFIQGAMDVPFPPWERE